jgi:muconate cycloisomerase
LAGKERVYDICRFIKDVLKINKIKLKLNRSYDGNRQILQAARQVYGNDYDLKIDVNCDWGPELAMAHLDLIRQYDIRVVEQPMTPGHPNIAEFSARLGALGVALMADESACSLEEVKRLQAEGCYNMINVRLSKCGGIRNSLRIIDFLRRKKIPFQIACQLGESGILSAAGRIISLLCRDAIYYDGSYDEFLLKENVTKENVSFGPGGQAGPLEGPGLGVIVSRQNLTRLSANVSPLSLSKP